MFSSMFHLFFVVFGGIFFSVFFSILIFIFFKKSHIFFISPLFAAYSICFISFSYSLFFAFALMSSISFVIFTFSFSVAICIFFSYSMSMYFSVGVLLDNFFKPIFSIFFSSISCLFLPIFSFSLNGLFFFGYHFPTSYYCYFLC